jgi:hypothetical protein
MIPVIRPSKPHSPILDRLFVAIFLSPLYTSDTSCRPEVNCIPRHYSMTSVSAPFDRNAYANRQQDHHERMLKHSQITIKPESDLSISTQFHHVATSTDPHAPSRSDSSTSDSSLSLPSPLSMATNMAEPFIVQPKPHQAVSLYTCPDEGKYTNSTESPAVDPTWFSQPYYGTIQQNAHLSQGLGVGKSFKRSVLFI